MSLMVSRDEEFGTGQASESVNFLNDALQSAEDGDGSGLSAVATRIKLNVDTLNLQVRPTFASFFVSGSPKLTRSLWHRRTSCARHS